MADSNDTSIALLSQKVDLYREESVNQRAGINDQLGGIKDLLEAHVGNIGDRLDDHESRIKKNTADIVKIHEGNARTKGIVATVSGLMVLIGGGITIVFGVLENWFSGGGVHH